MEKFTHLTAQDRNTIQTLLNDRISFKAIGRTLGKSSSSVAREVKGRYQFRKTGCFGSAFNDCKGRFHCEVRLLCDNPGCKTKWCRSCKLCTSLCKAYEKETCDKLKHSPYVCNGCKKLQTCTLEKRQYIATAAQNEYEQCLKESRQGFSLTTGEIGEIDKILAPLTKNGHSLHHICTNNRDAITVSERTLYRLTQGGKLSIAVLDLPRAVKFRKRKSKASQMKVDPNCRKGRTYQDFLAFMEENPDISVVEVDSVIGRVGGKALLTLHFKLQEFMLAFIRDHNNARTVTQCIDFLYLRLGHDLFTALFPVLLGDNGSEFSDPLSIEFSKDGRRRTRVFYCDPGASHQKGALENNHTFIRRVLPKGTDFDSFTQEKISLMMSHVNSYKRKKLNDISPNEAFSFFHGVELLPLLGISQIAPNDIILTPNLLK